VLVGFAADRTGRRGIFNIGFALIGCAGFSMLVASRNAKVSYAGTFLAAVGIYPCIANTITWVSNNVEGVYKRGVSLGTVIAWGNLNGVMSSNIYRQVDAPWYTLGHAVLLGYLAVCLLGGSIANYIFLSIGNRRRDVGGEELRSKLLDGLTEEERRHLADFHPDFRYTL
jgi:MFS family permease